MTIKGIPFEVNCFDVVSTNQVVVKNMVTGKELLLLLLSGNGRMSSMRM